MTKRKIKRKCQTKTGAGVTSKTPVEVIWIFMVLMMIPVDLMQKTPAVAFMIAVKEPVYPLLMGTEVHK